MVSSSLIAITPQHARNCPGTHVRKPARTQITHSKHPDYGDWRRAGAGRRGSCGAGVGGARRGGHGAGVGGGHRGGRRRLAAVRGLRPAAHSAMQKL